MLLEELEKLSEGAVIEAQDSGEEADTLTEPASKRDKSDNSAVFKNHQ